MTKLLKALAVASGLAFVGSVIAPPIMTVSTAEAAAKKKSTKKPVKKVKKGKKARVAKAAKSCGTYMYRKGSKCVDTRVTPPAKKK